MVNVVVMLVIVALVAIFSAQNTTPVIISFLFWKFQTPLAVVIFFSIFAGVLITSIVSFSGAFKRFTKKKNVQ